MDAGLALSGGGIRGAAHVGAIRALEENGINITAVSGTSAGSIVASLYAMGYKEDEIIKLFRYFSKSVLGLSPKNFFSGIKEKKGIGLGGITSSYNIENAIKEVSKLKGIKNIQDIQMPIAIPTTDLLTEKEYIFTNSKRLQGKKYIKDIEIGKAVRASSCFPGMYSPFEYKEFQFVDGGVFDNLPVKEAKRLTDSKIIAIKFKNTPLRKQKTVYNIAMHSLDLMNEVIIKEALKESDYVLEIDLKEVKPFSISKIDFCYKEGYMQTVDNISKIKKCLKS